MRSATLSPNKRHINKTVEDIERLNERCEQIWKSRGNYGLTKQAKINSRLMETQIRPLDLLRENLFHKLWRLHEETDFEFAEMEEISREKRFNGRKDVTRITYCDGVFHYVTNSKDKFQYGYACTC